MTTYNGTDAKIETGAVVLHADDLEKQLADAMQEERLAAAARKQASDRWFAASRLRAEIETEYMKRGFEAVGVVWGKSEIKIVSAPGMGVVLASGVINGTLMVREMTRTGKWYKNARALFRVKPSEITVVK